MIIKHLSTFLSILLYSTSPSSSPIRDSYIINMPMHVDLNTSGSFIVSMSESTINDNDTVSIEFDDCFVLHDSHGKNDINGTILNPNISFDSQNNNEQTIYYQFDSFGAGDWNGELNVKISLEQKEESGVLLDGTSINNILKTLNPDVITFAHNYNNENYLYDLSSAQDESILLYSNNNEVIISNRNENRIKANNDMSNLFSHLDITTINNLNYVDMSNCENMSKMFQMCENLPSIDVSSFNTTNVKDMSYMFNACHKCTSIIGLENFDVSNVENLSHFLNDNRALLTVPDLTLWNISNKCKDISYMMSSIAYTAGRNGMSKWPTTEVDYTSWDVSGVNNMSHAFYNAFMLTTLNLTGWDTSNVTDMSSMFEMYDNTDKSRLATIKGIESFNISNVINMDRMFYECRNLSANFSSWIPTNIESLVETFYDTRKLDLSAFENWNTLFSKDNVNYKDCFGSYAGYNVNKTYKPSWYQ